MRLGNYCWLLFCSLVGFSTNSSAATEYYWYHQSYPSEHFNTLAAACEVMVPRIFPGRTWTLEYVNPDANLTGRCRTYYNGSYYGPVSISRTGDGCGTGTYDPTTYSCIPAPDCSSKASTSKPFSKSGSAGDNYMTLTSGAKPIAIASQVGCFDGCMASTADQKCTTKTTGAYFCRGIAWFDGQSCAVTGTPGVDSSSSSSYPDSQQTTDNKPCNYTTNADGTQSCTSSNGTEKEGQICGTVSATGQKICVDMPPTKQGLDITTNVKTETDANGIKTTTKTDTATTTKCVDIKSCVISSTTVTTVVKSDGNGKVTSTTGSCTGANCPDKNTNPDGDGDGFGDCVTGDCGDGDGEGGGGQDWYEKGDDTYQSVMADFVEDAKQVPIVTSVKGFLDFAPAGSCPRYSVEAWVFTIQLDQWCTTSIPWSLIAAVVIGTAAFISFRIAFT